MKRMFSSSSSHNAVIENLPIGSRLCAVLSFSSVDFDEFSNYFSFPTQTLGLPLRQLNARSLEGIDLR